MQHNHVTVVGMFETQAAARAAVEQLRTRNLDIDDISVIERDPSRYDPNTDYSNTDFEYREYSTEEFGDETAGGLVLGALTGGTLGTLAGLGALTIPGIGPVVAAGPLVGALIGGTTGAVTGTLAGALIDAFEMPEEHAELYNERLSEGRTMVAVHVDPLHATVVRDILRDAGAERYDWPTTNYQYTYEDYQNWPENINREERQPYVWVR